MEDAVAVALQHLGMDVEAGVAQLGDLLRQQLHAVHRVAKYYGLVDLQLQTHNKLAILLHRLRRKQPKHPLLQCSQW